MKDLTLKMSKNEVQQVILKYPTNVACGLYVSGCRDGRVQISADKDYPGSEHALGKIAETHADKMDRDFVWETWRKQ